MQQDEKNGKVRRHLGHIIRKLDNVLKRNIQMAMAGQGTDELTAANGWIIVYLHHNRERNIYQKDVEAEFSIGRSAVTTVITRMEEKGLIRRESDPADARLKRLILTPKGEEQFRLMHATIEWVNDRQTEGITEAELEQCFCTLKKIAGNGERLNERMAAANKDWVAEIIERREHDL